MIVTAVIGGQLKSFSKLVTFFKGDRFVLTHSPLDRNVVSVRPELGSSSISILYETAQKMFGLVERSALESEQTFLSIDGSEFERVLPSSHKDGIRVQKLPIIINALRIDKPFQVKTLEGVMDGKPGDYLMQGVDDELYVCDADMFDQTYKILETK